MTQRYYKRTRDSITEDGEQVSGSENVKEFYNPFKDGVGYNFKYKSTFIKNYLGISLPIEKIGKDENGKRKVLQEGFDDIELGRLYRVSKMMYSDTNWIAYRNDMSVVPYTRSDIQKVIGIHRTKFVPFWKKLIDFKIIKTVVCDDKTYFCMNPLYYNTTTYMPMYLFMAFQKELQDHIPKWAIEKYLGMRPKPEDVNKPAETCSTESGGENGDKLES